ncbi:hypothetical protein [Chryseobacterium mucoviscidosis]|uniref:Uncharacterized protein n=1 Tax=Chryseobacterium mucoviscidosis TaxID=1945581 RepID=A0A202BP17_9FLAO|nr:hypothetical protein [Chryseobacterium mucoviscidosis]OVE53233.1 hypothetical protein B0E34_20645 [Chryseobacterium mucoviscidosis]
MGKIVDGFSFGFIHILIFLLLIHRVISIKDVKSVGAFFLIQGGTCRQKRYFSAPGKIRGSGWEAMEAEWFPRSVGKHFA